MGREEACRQAIAKRLIFRMLDRMTSFVVVLTSWV